MSKNISKKSAEKEKEKERVVNSSLEVFTNKYINKTLNNFGRFFVSGFAFVFAFTFILLSFSLVSFALPIHQVQAESPFVFTNHLELGVVGNNVKELQTLLNSKGYEVGIPDGKFGPFTKAQVILFQKDNGLTPDGIIGQGVRAFLNVTSTITSPTTLAVSSITSLPRTLELVIPRIKGDDVRSLQTFLNNSGYNCGIVDGSFGPKTEAQVKLFQTANNLTPDGKAGKNTLAVISQSPVSNYNYTNTQTRTSGCNSSLGFSTTTGQSCTTIFLPTGCNSTSFFSITTGLSCGIISLPTGCTSSSLFSTTSGVSCTTGLPAPRILFHVVSGWRIRSPSIQYASTPISIVLAVGSTAPVGGVTNVAIPSAGGTDTTGIITGYVATSADKIKFTVVDGGSATSTITINGGVYTSGTDYQIVPTISLPTIVVTTTEASKATSVRTFVITGPILGVDGLTYGIVMGADGKKWLDRNLGATQVATSATDYLAYGSIFQWGRGADGHQLVIHTGATAATSVNGSTMTLSVTDTPGNNLFIKSLTTPYDWRNSQNDNLWQGVNGVNNVCPAGFRLPTNTEQQTLITAAGITDMATAYSSSLKFTAAGLRSTSDSFLGSLWMGTSGLYWSSSVNGASALNLYFNASAVYPADVTSRAHGLSVRCFKD